MAKIVIEKTIKTYKEVEIDEENINFSDLMRNLDDTRYLREIELDGNQIDFQEQIDEIKITMTNDVKAVSIT